MPFCAWKIGEILLKEEAVRSLLHRVEAGKRFIVEPVRIGTEILQERWTSHSACAALYDSKGREGLDIAPIYTDSRGIDRLPPSPARRASVNAKT
jgi:hypothetical protein